MHIERESVVIITGASRGIGRAAAISFARMGCRIALASRDEAKTMDTARQVKEAGSEAHFFPCDVSIEENCDQLVEQTVAKWGRVDVLVNNAGFGHYASVEQLTTESLDRIFRTNLYGTIWCTQAVLPIMKKQKRGHIVNVSTIVSRRSIPYMSAYCMTKFAMNAMDEALRLEVRRYGIGVSLVAPGLTATDFQENAGKIEGFGPPKANLHGMSSEKVGNAIARAVEKNKRDVFLTAEGRLMLMIQRLSPRFCDWLVDLFVVRRISKSV